MRIAVHNPTFLLQNQSKNFCGYNFEFFMKYVDVIYITDFRRLREYQHFFSKYGKKLTIVYTVAKLNQEADVLLGFGGVPYKILYRPLKRFRGLQIYHVMDYVFYPTKSNHALQNAGVEYVMAYCDHSKFNSFFHKKYPNYDSKHIISVPFGYGKRFHNDTPFSERINKAIALGSVNPTQDMRGGILQEYRDYYQNEQFTHRLRRQIVLERKRWSDCIDDKLPTYPETKNPFYDAPKELNTYTMFINDLGLMNFPPARTYEGIACGCVLVGEDVPTYKEFGFVNGKNCILFEQGNYEQMVEKVRYYMNHSEELEKLQKNSLKLAENYTHKKIAERLYEEIALIYQSKVG